MISLRKIAAVGCFLTGCSRTRHEHFVILRLSSRNHERSQERGPLNSLESHPNQNRFLINSLVSSLPSIENQIGIPVALVPIREGGKSFAAWSKAQARCHPLAINGVELVADGGMVVT